MDKNNLINLFFIDKRNSFPAYRISSMMASLQEMSEEKLQLVTIYDYPKPSMVFFLSYFIGIVGVDRFVIGDILIGVLKLLTLGGLGIWYIIDLFIIINRTKCNNYRTFESLSYQISI